MAGFERTLQDFTKRTQDNNRSLMQGDINVGQRLLRSTGDIVGLGGGLFGDTLGVVGDYITPDSWGVEAAYKENIEKPLQEAIMSAADTDIGRKAVKFAKENDELMTDLGAISNVLTVTPVGKIANSVARNMPTEVRGFYSGNPLVMAAGIAEAGASGTKNALLSAFNPKALALQAETGITKGLTQQAKQAEALVTRRIKLQEQAKQGPYDQRIKAQKDLDKFDKRWDSYGSMTEGALAYNYLFRKQMGEDIPAFLQKNFEKMNVLSSGVGPSKQKFNNMVFEEPRTKVTNSLENPSMSAKNQDYVQDRIYKTWEIGDKERGRTAIVVKDPEKQHSMTDQARKGRNDPALNFLFYFDKSLDLNSAAPSEVIAAATGRSLTKVQKDIVQKNKDGKSLTEPQLKTLKEAERRLASEPKMTWDADQELFVIQDSFKSGAKELGGVNRITTLNKNGDVNVIVSDRHDMLGFDPIDGKPLITVFPPIQYNVYRGRGKDTYNAGETPEQARKRLADELGETLDTVKPSYTQAGQIKQGSSKRLGGEVVGEYSPIGVEPTPFPKDSIYGSRSGVARRVNQRIAQEAQNFSPTAGQLAAQAPRVATNAALAANYGAGMLSGQIPQEEQ